MPNPFDIRFMKSEERAVIQSWRKLDYEVDEFVYVWTRWKKWGEEPPIVAAVGNSLVGYHGLSFTKSGYTNSVSQFVLEKYRGLGLAGDMIDLLLKESARRGIKRLRFRTPKNSPGFYCWTGFGVVPFGKCKKDYWFDLGIAGVDSVAQLVKAGSTLHLPPTEDKRRLGYYRRSKVKPLIKEYRSIL